MQMIERDLPRNLGEKRSKAKAKRVSSDLPVSTYRLGVDLGLGVHNDTHT